MRCEPCRATGLIHCSDPENCGGPWSKPVELTPPKEDDWLDTSKACNLGDPECEACQ